MTTLTLYADATKERLKFRELRMKAAESFAEWVLRLQGQASLCEFRQEQREEEMLQAVTRGSIPGIAEKLYEMAKLVRDLLRQGHKSREAPGLHTEGSGGSKVSEDRRAAVRAAGKRHWVGEAVSLSSVQTIKARQYNGRIGGRRGETGRQNSTKYAKCFSCGRTGHFVSIHTAVRAQQTRWECWYPEL